MFYFDGDILRTFYYSGIVPFLWFSVLIYVHNILYYLFEDTKDFKNTSSSISMIFFHQGCFSCWVIWISFMLEQFLKCLASLVSLFVFKLSPLSADWKPWWCEPASQAMGFTVDNRAEHRPFHLGTLRCQHVGLFLRLCSLSLRKKVLTFCLQAGFQAVQVEGR